MKTAHTLTKTHFIKGLQCHRALFLNVFKPKLKIPFSDEAKALMQEGRVFESNVRQNFLPAIDVSKEMGPRYAAYARFTETCLKQTADITVFEAGLQHENVLVLVDILKRVGNTYELYEIKRSKQLTDTILNDAAFQYVVAKLVLQTEVNSFVILRVDENDHQIIDVTSEVRSLASAIETEMSTQLKLLAKGKEPIIATGPHCDTPYPCDFKGYCQAVLF